MSLCLGGCENLAMTQDLDGVYVRRYSACMVDFHPNSNP